MLRLLSLSLIALLFSHCSSPEGQQVNQSPLTGLWGIKDVKVGQETMTPIAKWIRINSDGTQEGGNGWLQHSIGTWTYQSSDSSLTIVNTNGWKEESAPFQAKVENNLMTWSRTEGDQLVTVTAERIQILPVAPANKILGVWALDQVEEADSIQQGDKSSFLFIAWDHRFRTRLNGKDRQVGIWKFHGHRPLLEMIYYDENNTRMEWEVTVSQDSLTLSRTSSYEQTPLIQRYHRIDYFPQ